MTKEEFVEKVALLNAEMQVCILKDEYDEIERLSKRIGRIIVKYLDERKSYIKNNRKG